MRASPPQSTRQIGFLLIPNFSLLSYASTIEPLRAANRLSGRKLYQWRHISTDGQPVEASSGIQVVADHKVGDAVELDTLFVCAGGNPALFRQQRTMAWLRSLARGGIRVGGVSGGPYILARAGLLDGYRCTIHWEHMEAFREKFPRLEPSRTLYEIDRDRLTCAGGVAALDMMRAVIGGEHGPALATGVSEWFLQTHLRLGSGSQRMTLRERYGVTSPPLLSALQFMETSIHNPLSRQALAKKVELSVRQLERLFANHLKTTIAAQYIRIRLDRARTLIHETAMPILEIAVACGFVSGSHFSRAYKSQFGFSPKSDRGIQTRSPDQVSNNAMRPAL
jgi:transcriptional regulator GlxA family with amidase domain